jgi:hypothetical protein
LRTLIPFRIHRCEAQRSSPDFFSRENVTGLNRHRGWIHRRYGFDCPHRCFRSRTASIAEQRLNYRGGVEFSIQVANRQGCEEERFRLLSASLQALNHHSGGIHISVFLRLPLFEYLHCVHLKQERPIPACNPISNAPNRTPVSGCNSPSRQTHRAGEAHPRSLA